MPQQPQVREFDDELLKSLGISHYDDELLGSLGISRKDKGFLQRVQEGAAREIETIKSLGARPDLPPDFVGPPQAPRSAAAQAFDLAKRAGSAVGEFFAPDSPQGVVESIASTVGFFVPQEGDKGVSGASKLATEFTGVPAALRTGKRVVGAAMDPRQALESFAESPIFSTAEAALDAALISPGLRIAKRALPAAQAARRAGAQATAIPEQKLLPAPRTQMGASTAEADILAQQAEAAAQAAREAAAPAQARRFVDDIAEKARVDRQIGSGEGLVGPTGRVEVAQNRNAQGLLEEANALRAQRAVLEKQAGGLPTRLKVVDNELATLDNQIQQVQTAFEAEVAPVSAKFLTGGAATPRTARAVQPVAVPQGGGLKLGRTPQPASELPEVAAVNQARGQLDQIAQAAEMPRDIYLRHIVGVTGNPSGPTTLAEVQGVLRSMRRSIETGAPPPSGPEIRAAIKRLRGRGEAPAPKIETVPPVVPSVVPPGTRPPGVTSGRFEAPRTIQTLAGEQVPVVTTTMPKPLQQAAPASAIFENELNPIISGAGQRVLQSVREWTSFGTMWPDFNYLVPGVGETLRGVDRVMTRRFKASVSRLSSAYKWMGRSEERNLAVARALLNNKPTGNAAVDQAFLTIKNETRAMRTLLGETGDIGFVEGYLPVIAKYESYGGIQQIPRDIHRYASLKALSPHRKAGPNAPTRARMIERQLTERGVRVEEMVNEMLYMGYRDIYMQPMLEKSTRFFNASRALTSRGIATGSRRLNRYTTVEQAMADIETFSPRTQKVIREAQATLAELGEARPMTIVQQDVWSAYMPKFTGGAALLDWSGRFDNFIKTRTGFNPQSSRRATTLTRNTLTALIGFAPKTAVKQVTQLGGGVVDVGSLPLGFGLLMGTVGEPAARLGSAALRAVGARGTRVEQALRNVRPVRSRLGSISGEMDLLKIRGFQSRLGRAYDKTAFGMIEGAEAYVRGTNAWAGMASHRIRTAAGTAERTMAGGQVVKIPRYTRIGAARAGIIAALEAQFGYGVAAESVLFSTMGSVGIMANGLTTFARKITQFFSKQIIERPLVQAARDVAAVRGRLQGTVTSQELGRELLLRTPQELASPVRFYMVWGAMDMAAEKLGLNLDDVTGFMPAVSVFRGGSPFAVFDPFWRMAKVTETQLAGTELEQAEALVDFVESVTRWTKIPIVALNEWARWWRDVEVNDLRMSRRPEVDPNNLLAPQNIPVIGMLTPGGLDQGPITLTEATLRALVAEPARLRDIRELMDTMTAAREEWRSLREQARIDVRAALTEAMKSRDEEALVASLSMLHSLGVDIPTMFDPPQVKMFNSLSDIEKAWFWVRYLDDNNLDTSFLDGQQQ